MKKMLETINYYFQASKKILNEANNQVLNEWNTFLKETIKFLNQTTINLFLNETHFEKKQLSFRRKQVFIDDIKMTLEIWLTLKIII